MNLLLEFGAESVKETMITEGTFSSCRQFCKGFSCSAEMAVKSGVLALLYSLFLISGIVFSDITSFNDDCLVKIKSPLVVQKRGNSLTKCKQMGKLKCFCEPDASIHVSCIINIYTREDLIISLYKSNERLHRNFSGEMYNKLHTKLRRGSSRDRVC